MAGNTTATETHVANADHGEAGFPPFDPSTYASQLVWLAITFVVLYLLISRIVAPRIGGILEVRQDRIEGDKAEALRLKDETDQAIAAYEQSLAEARSKAHTIAQSARDDAKATADAERAQLEADLASKLAAAESKVADMKAQAMAEVNGIAAEITGDLVSALSGKAATEKQIDAALSKQS